MAFPVFASIRIKPRLFRELIYLVTSRSIRPMPTMSGGTWMATRGGKYLPMLSTGMIPRRMASLFYSCTRGSPLASILAIRGMTMRCQHCHGPFGLIRRRMLTFSGYLVFCSTSCIDEYRKRLQQEVRKRKFHDWLTRDRSTT
jgi:hypothetical protein